VDWVALTVAVSVALSVSCKATTPTGTPVHGRELVRPLTSIRIVPALHRATT
jgi:hypothetical protein